MIASDLAKGNIHLSISQILKIQDRHTNIKLIITSQDHNESFSID